MPKISVIVPIYKVEKYLVQCIDSILAQTLTDIEVILVDEGDMDACRFIIDHYEQTDSRVKTIHEKNGGYGASVNKGFDMATGEYISIIESDDFIEPTMYEEMYNYAKKLDADVVKTPYYEYWEKTKKKPERRRICSYAQELAEACPKNKSFSIKECPQLMAVHASLWSGIYKTSYMKEKNIRFITAKGGAYVDVGFRIDTLVNTDKIAWYDKPFYVYRLSNETSTTNQFNLDAMLERWAEAHKSFADKMELYEKIGSELLYDEYLNTVGYLRADYKVTREHIKKMKDNLSFVPDNVIKNSKRLSDKQKKLVFGVKYGEIVEKNDGKAWFSTKIAIKKTQTTIHIFRAMKHNIIRNMFRIGGIYVVDFCVGKVK